MKIHLTLAAAALAFATVAQAQQQPWDYSSEDAWLCRPGRSDACAIDHSTTIVSADGSMRREDWTADPAAPIDCFYVYPTVSTDTTLYSDMNADPAETNVVAQQFARFGSECRTFAPLYRQVTLRGLSGGGTSLSSGTNYNDVLAAWRHYLANDNQGRGFILVGHSQGAYILTELIRQEIDGKPVQAQMVSAMLIGATVPLAKDGPNAGMFGSIPPCQMDDQFGCLISFVSFRSSSPPPENSRFGRVADPALQAACTNPAALGGGSADLHAYLSADGRTIIGTTPTAPWVAGGAAIETPWVSVPGMLTARCTSNEHATYLEVTVNADPADPRVDDIIGDIGRPPRVALDWGLHLIDVNLAMGNLVDLAGRQAAAWQNSRR